MGGDGVEAFAPAKINLGLHVIGRRHDGYHELDMLVGFADIGDQVSWRAGGDSCRLAVEAEQAGIGESPLSTGNLAWRALALAGKRAGAPLSGSLTVHKVLPSGAGLGGGSSDAAAVLCAVLGERARAELAADPAVLSLGADVPVCLAAQPSRVGGIGDRISPAPFGHPIPVVLVWPGQGLSTPAVFEARQGPFGAPIPDATIEDLRRDPLAAIATLRNDLESAAIGLLPGVGAALHALGASPGCRVARMSGSGSSVVGYFSRSEEAQAAAERVRRDWPNWWARSGMLRADPLNRWNLAALS